MTPEEFVLLADVLREAREIVPRCGDPDCDDPAEFIVWKHGMLFATQMNRCSTHVPVCTEERGGWCKEGHNLARLTRAVYLLDEYQRTSPAEDKKDGT